MKVDIKKLPKSEVQLTITVPYETYRKWEKKALEDISHKLKVPGFRPGNMPEDVIRKNVQEEALKASTLDYVLPQTYAEAVKENDIQVIARPHVDIKSDVEKEGDELVYEVKVAVMPEVKMGDYKKIKVKRKEAKVDPKSVDETIQMVMDRYAEWKDVDRKAGEGDRAEVDFEGFGKEDKPIPNTASKNHPVILGAKAMVPGFEDAIMGMSKGESKEFDITFPKDYHAKAMQGQKVKFRLTLNRLEEKMEQTLDEAMVEKVTGQKQSVEDFKKLVEGDLKNELERRGKEEHENAIVSEIIKITKADIPEALMEQEIGAMMEDQKRRVAQQGITWEQYLEHIKKTEEDFKKDHRQAAQQRVLARLGVQQIIKDANITASDEETKAKIDEMIAKYPKDQQEKVREHYKEDGQAYQYLKNSIAADKLFDMLSK